MSKDPRARFPLGAVLAGGGYTIETRLHGDRFRGLYTGTSRSGARVMVTVAPQQQRPVELIAADLALPVDGVLRLLHVGPVPRVLGGDDYDALVEDAPPGQAVAGLPLPLAPRAALALAIAVAMVAERAHAARLVLGEIRPELTFVDAEARFVGLTPRCDRFLASAARANFIQPPLFEDLCWAPEVLADEEPGPASDVFAVGLLLARVAAGEYPFRGEGRAQQSFAIAEGAAGRRPFSGSPVIGAMVEPALELTPEHRPSMAEWRMAAVRVFELLP